MSQNKERLVTAQEAQVLVQDPLCEKMVLGTILNFGAVYDQLAETLDDECFREGRCLGVWQAMKSVRGRGENVDIITVTAELAKEGSTIQPWEVVEISQNGSVTSNIEFYAYRLKDLSLRRRLWRLGQKLVNAGVAETDDVTDIQQLATEELNGLFGQSRGVITLTQALLKLTDIINDNLNNKHITGSYTGFRRLDEKGGLHGSDLIIIAGETSQGKALPMNAKILTPTGWVENKDLKIGDEVSSIDGQPSFVRGVYYQGYRQMYKITFCDGREVVCSDQHLWKVSISNRKPQIKTAEYIYEKYSKKRHNTLSIPSFGGEFGDEKNYLIHPYLMGVLIGDGSLTDRSVRWGKPDKYIVDKVSSLIDDDYYVKTTKYRDWECPVHYILPKRQYVRNKYKKELVRLKIWGKLSQEKFIPKEYLECCRKQRLELLNGLIDTDGYVSEIGSISYTTTSKMLCNDVVYLCHSLGYKAYWHKKVNNVNGKEYLPLYWIYITPTNPYEVATLPRKKVRLKPLARRNISILKIEKTKPMECQCISVSHPSSLYVTDGFIMTHNTSLALSMALNVISKGERISFYSLEMTDVQLTARLVAMKSGVSSSDIMYSNKLNPSELELIDTAKGILPGENVFFDDESTSNLENILLSIRMMKLRHDINGAVVDYLQILNVNQKNSSYTREQAMGDAARRLKNLAKELDIWIIALSQLNRNAQDPVPTMARLRDSGQIAEAADVVMLVYRPEIYHRTFPQPFDDRTEEECRGLAMIDVAKGRNIGIFKFLVEFNANTTHFLDMDLGEPAVYEGPVEEDAPF